MAPVGDGLFFEWMPLSFLPLVFALLVLCRLRPSKGRAWAAAGASLGMGLAALLVIARSHFLEGPALLEEHASPATARSGEPWIQVLLEEKLSYWDPWWKGVVLPLLPVLGAGLAAFIFIAAPRKPADYRGPVAAIPLVCFDLAISLLGLLTLGAALVLLFGPGMPKDFGIEMHHR
jgi:hypothetical protein